MMAWVLENHYPQLRVAETIHYVMTIHDDQESELISLMEQAQRDYPSIKISNLPKFLAHGQVEIELGVKGEEHEARAACETIKTELQQRGLKVTML